MLPYLKRAGVIYSIPCKDCQLTYMGQTGRTLNHCVQAHRRAWQSGDVALAALAEHSVVLGHAIAWSDASVLDCSGHLREGCSLEVWYIRSQPHPLNQEQGRLSTTYNSLRPCAARVHHTCLFPFPPFLRTPYTYNYVCYVYLPVMMAAAEWPKLLAER